LKRRNPLAGFTLLEVIVALTLAALIVTLIRAVFAVLDDGLRGVAVASSEMDRAGNAFRWLQAAFAGAYAETESDAEFRGGRDGVSLAAWDVDSLGRSVRGRITIAAAGGHLIAATATGQVIALADSVASLECDYLLGLGADQHWMQQWTSPAGLPRAVRLRLDRHQRADTLLFVVGQRG
jgi:prepilin-type N-terminal cleavage/methylation domain-containing protein